jgi:hypothetical protein
VCFTCNNALGDFEDDPARLGAAISYLYEADELEPVIRRRVDGLKRVRPAYEEG